MARSMSVTLVPNDPCGANQEPNERTTAAGKSDRGRERERGRDIWEHAKRFSLAALANGENGANDATAIILESSDLSTKLD